MNETQRRFLRRLRDAQPDGLRRSAIPATCGNLVDAMRVCGAVEFVPARSGRGITLRISGEAAFGRFVASHCPQGLDVDLDALPDRAAAVFALADAKAIRRSVGQGLFVRSIKPHVEIRSADGEVTVPVSDLTIQAGGTGIQLSTERTWGFTGSIAVVENADAFWQHERVLPNVDLVLLAGGIASDRILKWLGSPPMADCQITHWGDYDPVGICEYLRLANACPDRVITFAPPDIEQLLPKFGKRTLITRQPVYLDRLRSRTANNYVMRMVRLFDRFRRGLEQEVLLRHCWTGNRTEVQDLGAAGETPY